MLGFARMADEVTETPASQAEQELAYFRERLSLPKSPNLLILSEQNYRQLRADRRERESRQNAIVRTWNAATNLQGGLGSLPDEYHSLSAEIEKLDAKVKAATVERAKRRDDFGTKAREALAPALEEFKPALLLKLNELEDLLSIAAELHGEAALAGIELQRLVGFAADLVGQVHTMRASLR